MAVEGFLLFVCLFSFMFSTKFCGVMCTILNSELERGTGGQKYLVASVQARAGQPTARIHFFAQSAAFNCTVLLRTSNIV